MNANEVLIDLLEDNRRRLCRGLDGMSDEVLRWRPEANANNILITVWHMGRMFDVFLTQQAKGYVSEQECWFLHGWAQQTGYDPRGMGLNGWGMLTGFSPQEVAAMPDLTRQQVLGYLNGVYDKVRQYLQITPIEMLEKPAAGFQGKYSQYQCIQMALMDNVRHLGEIYAIQSSWDRKSVKQDDMAEFRRQLEKGSIQKAYGALLAYMTALRTQFAKKYGDAAISSLYQGYLDMTYFALFPPSLKRFDLKVAIVFNYNAFRFEAWLVARNRKVQQQVWEFFKDSHWEKYRIVAPAVGVDAIVACELSHDFDINQPEALTATIENTTVAFIEDMKIYLSPYQPAGK